MAKKNNKSAAKKPVAGKVSKVARKKVATATSAVKKPVGKPSKAAKRVIKVAVAVKSSKKKSHFDGKQLAVIQAMLIKMRDRLTGQITALSDDTLKYIDDSSSEDRTDDFDREFALNLVSTEQDSVFEIDSALRRIKEGVYGYCDICGCLIEKARLQALPFARACVKCQSAAEKGRVRFRPFGEALEQGV